MVVSKFNEVINRIETKAKNGEYDIEDEIEDDIDSTIATKPRRGCRNRFRTNHYIEEQAKEREPKQQKQKRRRRKRRRKNDDVKDDSDDDSFTINRRSTHKKRNVLSDSEDEEDTSVRQEHIRRICQGRLKRDESSILDDDVDEEVLSNECDNNKFEYTPISQGGCTFCLKDELMVESDDDSPEVKETKMNYDLTYKREQRAKQAARTELARTELQSLKECSLFDDDCSETEDQKANIKTTVNGNNNVVNNNNVININHNHYSGNWTNAYNVIPRFISRDHNHQSFPLIPYQESHERTIRSLISEYRMRNYGGVRSSEWIERFEIIFNSIINGRELSFRERDWVTNQNRNRSFSLSRMQLNLIDQLIKLRHN